MTVCRDASNLRTSSLGDFKEEDLVNLVDDTISGQDIAFCDTRTANGTSENGDCVKAWHVGRLIDRDGPCLPIVGFQFVAHHSTKGITPPQLRKEVVFENRLGNIVNFNLLVLPIVVVSVKMRDGQESFQIFLQKDGINQ